MLCLGGCGLVSDISNEPDWLLFFRNSEIPAYLITVKELVE
jgi:hypothetical protein